ncbi:MAG: patatin-like phospholipase family protein [Candidatus Melainabacteria bacterium]|nr:patatin-like phospholipase family protein [Candidatus Melainabacteria bacterium]
MIRQRLLKTIASNLCAAILIFFQACLPVLSKDCHDPASGKRPRVGLALGGGGTRGAAHVGVIKVLAQEGIPIDMIAGTSMGAIVGGLYAAGLTADEIGTKFSDGSLMRSYMTVPIPVRIAAVPIFFMARMLGRKPYDGFYRGNKFAKYLNNSVPQDKRNIQDLVLPLSALATNLVDGKAYALKEGEFGRVLQASSAVPVLRRPVPLSGKLFVDGALVANVPVGQAREMGADIVIAVDVDERVSQVPIESFRKLGSVSKRILTLYLAQKDQEELDKADIVIHPQVDGIGLISTRIADAKHAMAAGEAAAREALPAIRQKLQSFQLLSTPTGKTVADQKLNDENLH